jgi:hypothetical protein
MTAYSTAWRGASIALGFACAGLGAYGAWEFSKKLEGAISYLVIAAPVVAASTALIPALIEWQAREKNYVKAVLWLPAGVAAAAVLFFAAAERVHVAKAGAQAERTAYSRAAQRAQSHLVSKRAELTPAQAEADTTKGWKVCGPKCTGFRETAERLTREVADAERALLGADKLTTAEAPLQAPVWLLPVALDLIAFMAIWSGLTGPRTKAPAKVQRKRRKPKARRKPKPKAPAPATPRNVVPIKAVS